MQQGKLPSPEVDIAFRGAAYIRRLAEQQMSAYRAQPGDVISHRNQEHKTLNAYRRRQLLELLQNADDAGEGFAGEKRVLLRLTDRYLIVANTGVPFIDRGIDSLVIADKSPKQLERNRYIGNKGLGFRAVLSWSREPLVLSGDFLIAFSPEHAKQQAVLLAGELPSLQEDFRKWSKKGERLPVATMRFPFVPPLDHHHTQEALRVQREGYDTVVLLPLPSSDHGSDVREDIRHQLDVLAGETVIFCRHLRRLTIETDERREWEVERDGPLDHQVIIIREQGKPDQLWTVYRQVDSLPAHLIDDDLRETPEFELAIAVPDQMGSGVDHRLCVYFPTDLTLPLPLLAHATLETDHSRKQLIDHKANEHVLNKLAAFLGPVNTI